jgi:hypothetical protein
MQPLMKKGIMARTALCAGSAVGRATTISPCVGPL